MAYTKKQLAALAPQVAKRIAIEQKIVRRCASYLLGAGYVLSVYDGEKITLKYSTCLRAIMDAMMTTDEDYLIASTKEGESYKHIGKVYFVYGNDGPDVINDYSVSLEAVVDDVMDYAESL